MTWYSIPNNADQLLLFSAVLFRHVCTGVHDCHIIKNCMRSVCMCSFCSSCCVHMTSISRDSMQRRRGLFCASGDVSQGQAAGTAAHLVALRREAIGKYSVKDAWTVEQLQAAVTELKEKKARGKTAEAALMTSKDGISGSVQNDKAIEPDN